MGGCKRLFPQSKAQNIVNSLFMDCQRHGFLAQLGVVRMCFFHCPGSNGTNTRFVAKLINLGLFCPDFCSDIEDFTQILCRYLPKKLAAKTSAPKSNSSTWPGDPHNVYIVSVIIVAF